jgi:hypothetical protein
MKTTFIITSAINTQALQRSKAERRAARTARVRMAG